MKQPLTASPSAGLKGRIRVPGDKSISHRALILGALATGRTRITGLLEAEDVLATAKAVQALGAEVERSNGAYRGDGPRRRRLAGPVRAARFRQFRHRQPPHARRRRRPRHESRIHRRCLLAAPAHGPRAHAVEAMGLDIDGDERPARPCRCVVRGTPDLLPIDYDLPVPSAQVKSAVLLAGLHAPGRTTVVEPLPGARSHRAHAALISAPNFVDRGSRRRRPRRHHLRRRRTSRRRYHRAGRSELCRVLIAAALISPGSDIVIEGVLMNPTRTGFIETLREMGADIELLDLRDEGRRAGRRSPRQDRASLAACACRPTARRA